MIEGKHILMGVSSSIACYKSGEIARRLVKMGAEVQVIMTKNATEFIRPLLFERLTSRRCLVDTFDRTDPMSIEHISAARWADVFVAAPATANLLAKFAHGIADDMLSTTALACTCPKLAAPAMNTAMYENPVTQDNLKTLEHYGWTVIEPVTGLLACGVVGKGKMADEDTIIEAVRAALCPKDMVGLKVLVTAGPTRESLDPVRFITNHSSGKMGYALAAAAAYRGADVTLVSGPCALSAPAGARRIDTVSAAEMADAVLTRAEEQDIIIMAAAVADYRPKEVSGQKLKKSDGEMTLEFSRTIDILGTLGLRRRPGQFLCGFAMETEDLLANAKGKREKKGADMICANSLTTEGAGFAGDTNQVTILTEDGCEELPLLSKEETAMRILDDIMKRR